MGTSDWSLTNQSVDEGVVNDLSNSVGPFRL